MKLSELTTERALDALCEITPYIANIVKDEALLEELKKAIDPEKASTPAARLAFGAEKITALVPLLLKQHKYDVFGILGALNEKTADEIASQNFITTGIQIRDALKDRELISFFKSCVSSEGNE